jgi:hypothetical protein
MIIHLAIPGIGDRVSAQQKSAHAKGAGKAMISSVPNVRQVVDETDQK